jgi:hypothetical protein
VAERGAAPRFCHRVDVDQAADVGEGAFKGPDGGHVHEVVLFCDVEGVGIVVELCFQIVVQMSNKFSLFSKLI